MALAGRHDFTAKYKRGKGDGKALPGITFAYVYVSTVQMTKGFKMA